MCRAFTADPQICANARLIKKIPMTNAGAGQPGRQSFAGALRAIGQTIFDTGLGGIQLCFRRRDMGYKGGAGWKAQLSGITCDRSDAQISVRHLPGPLENMAKVFGALAEAQIVVDVIVEDRSADGKANLTFTGPGPPMIRRWLW